MVKLNEALTHTPMPLAYPGACYPKDQGKNVMLQVEHARQVLMKELQDYPGDPLEACKVPLPDKLEFDAEPVCFTVPRLLNASQCKALIAYSEAVGFEQAKVNIDYVGVDMPEVRNNWRTMIDDGDVAMELFQRISPLLPTEMEGCTAKASNRRFRILRYDASQQFTDHRDGIYEENGLRSLLTFQIYLSDDFSAGTTTFIGQDGDETHVQPTTGTALVFSHSLLHKGTPPVGGRKYALRSEIMFSK